MARHSERGRGSRPPIFTLSWARSLSASSSRRRVRTAPFAGVRLAGAREIQFCRRDKDVKNWGPERTYAEGELADLNGDAIPISFFNTERVDFQGLTRPGDGPNPKTTVFGGSRRQ